MSIANTLLRAGLESTFSVHGEGLSVLSGPAAGMVFVGVITADADQILATQLGEDTRPKCRLMLQRPAPVTLTAQNMIRDEAGNRFRVVQRMDNPDQTAIEYELIQISEGKDT